jgi:hypothetical protein
MVKSCRTFDPGLVYSMDAIGVISTSLPKKLEWHVGDVKFVSEKARVAGQSSACNDLQPRARVVGEVHALITSSGLKSIVMLSLPRRSACRRSCWEVHCDRCKALRKRKNCTLQSVAKYANAKKRVVAQVEPESRVGDK